MNFDKFAIYLFILIFVFCGYLYPQYSADGIINPSEYEYKKSLSDEKVIVYWKIEGDEIKLAFKAKTKGWVALGLDPENKMDKADMISGCADNSGKQIVADCYSMGMFGPHPEDIDEGGTNDILEYGANEKDGITSIEFTRKLSTGDKLDKDIPLDKPLKVIWGVGQDDDIQSMHNDVGKGTINFTLKDNLIPASEQETQEKTQKENQDKQNQNGTNDTELAETSTGNKILLWPFHAIALGLGFLLMLTGILIKRYTKEKWTFKVHKTLEIIATASCVLGLAMGIYMVSVSQGGHFTSLHSLVGLVTLIIVFLTPFFGLLKSLFGISGKLKLTIHKWMGRTAGLGMAINIFLGLSLVGII